jgi:hypothetical protein
MVVYGMSWYTRQCPHGQPVVAPTSVVIFQLLFAKAKNQLGHPFVANHYLGLKEFQSDQSNQILSTGGRRLSQHIFLVQKGSIHAKEDILKRTLLICVQGKHEDVLGSL